MKFAFGTTLRSSLPLAALLLAACGGGGNTTTPSAATQHTIGGNVSGMTGSVVLQNNNGDNLTVPANGAFTFAAKIGNGSTYAVSVLTNPVGQTCSPTQAVGTVPGANISNVVVTCANASYSVGGSVTGLAANDSVVLQANGADNLTVTANAAFTFVTPIASTSPYVVSVLTQPAGKACAVVNGSGTIAGAAITNVAVHCTGKLAGAIQGTSLNLSLIHI